VVSYNSPGYGAALVSRFQGRTVIFWCDPAVLLLCLFVPAVCCVGVVYACD